MFSTYYWWVLQSHTRPNLNWIRLWCVLLVFFGDSVNVWCSKIQKCVFSTTATYESDFFPEVVLGNYVFYFWKVLWRTYWYWQRFQKLHSGSWDTCLFLIQYHLNTVLTASVKFQILLGICQPFCLNLGRNKYIYFE